MKNIKPFVFYPPVVLILAAVVLSFIDKDAFSKMIIGANNWLMGNFAWAFNLGVVTMLFIIIYILFSPLGRVRIGGSKAVPLLDTWRWFSVTLTTGIAIGILFWATAEPMYHLSGPPVSLGIAPNSPQAAVFAMSTMFLHWSFVPYAIYTIPTIMFAFAYYNMKKPFSLGSTLYPILGERALGGLSNSIDAVCLYALVAGMAASLGTGILTVSGGINYLTGIQSGAFLWAIVDIAIVATFVISSITGLTNGIKKLSEINTVIFMSFAVFIFICGPTAFLLNLGTESIGDFFQNFFTKTLFTGAAAQDPWGGWWTIFYWCNWLAWAPISAVFLGRISYGHTIRKAIVINMILPAIFSVLWMTIFSGSALHIQLLGSGGILEALNSKGPEACVYLLLSKFPLAIITIPIFVFTAFLSYVTGADANASAMGGLSTTGITPDSPEPSIFMKVFWGALLGVVAWVMIAFAGIDGVKMLSNLGGGPSLLLELGMCISLILVAANPKKYDVFKEDYTEDGTPIISKTLLTEEQKNIAKAKERTLSE